MQELRGKVFRDTTNICFIVGKSELGCWVNRKDSLLKTWISQLTGCEKQD